jgi:hypothetical protein
MQVPASSSVLYEEELVNRSQMDIKHKTCDIRICKKYLFLDMSTTNINTLLPSLYQCIETCSIEIFWCCLSHFCTSISTSSVISETFAAKAEWLYTTNTSHHKQKNISLGISLALSPSAHKKPHNRTLLFGSILLKAASEHALACLLPRLSWS